ncbi:MAG: serpin family protein [Candidatus Latescibacterota bacterium]
MTSLPDRIVYGTLLALFFWSGVPPVFAQAQSSNNASSDLSELVAGNTAFSLDLYHALRTSNTNLFISPYSISSSLAMASAGARNETAHEMERTLRFPPADKRLHYSFKSLNARIGNDPDMRIGAGEKDFRLIISNSLWGQDGHRFLEDYLDVLQGAYGAEVRQVDFIRNSREARKAVNDWVSRKTEGKITEILPPGGVSSETRLVLVNAVYFHNVWFDSFSLERTREEPFTLLDGRKVMVPMMRGGGMRAYTEGEGFQAVEILYRYGKTSMIILLPQPGRFKAFEQSLNPAKLASILSDMEKHSSLVVLKLPRFRIEHQPFSLRNALESMGMRRAFTGGADFSGMDGQKGLQISDVFHRTFIRVDEYGTEAAASTAAAFVKGRTDNKVEFIADRPFLFLIRDRNTGTILFLGRVLNPKSE